MPMNNFLFNVLIHGTSYSENGKGVSINKRALSGNSTILFFHVDDENSIIKQQGGNVCDLLIYISHKNNGNNKNNVNDLKLLILVELKGSEIGHAIEQIKQTYNKINQKLNRYLNNHNKKWIAIIVASGSATKQTDKYKKELKRIGIELVSPKTGRRGTIDITDDIKKYLR